MKMQQRPTHGRHSRHVQKLRDVDNELYYFFTQFGSGFLLFSIRVTKGGNIKNISYRVTKEGKNITSSEIQL